MSLNVGQGSVQATQNLISMVLLDSYIWWQGSAAPTHLKKGWYLQYECISSPESASFPQNTKSCMWWHFWYGECMRLWFRQQWCGCCYSYAWLIATVKAYITHVFHWASLLNEHIPGLGGFFCLSFTATLCANTLSMDISGRAPVKLRLLCCQHLCFSPVWPALLGLCWNIKSYLRLSLAWEHVLAPFF